MAAGSGTTRIPVSAAIAVGSQLWREVEGQDEQRAKHQHRPERNCGLAARASCGEQRDRHAGAEDESTEDAVVHRGPAVEAEIQTKDTAEACISVPERSR